MSSITRINRDDMLELTRRMTIARTSMTRIAGSYMDADGFIDGTFNTNFLKLKNSEKEKNLTSPIMISSQSFSESWHFSHIANNLSTLLSKKLNLRE